MVNTEVNSDLLLSFMDKHYSVTCTVCTNLGLLSNKRGMKFIRITFSGDWGSQSLTWSPQKKGKSCYTERYIIHFQIKYYTFTNKMCTLEPSAHVHLFRYITGRNKSQLLSKRLGAVSWGWPRAGNTHTSGHPPFFRVWAQWAETGCIHSPRCASGKPMSVSIHYQKKEPGTELETWLWVWAWGLLWGQGWELVMLWCHLGRGWGTWPKLRWDFWVHVGWGRTQERLGRDKNVWKCPQSL